MWVNEKSGLVDPPLAANLVGPGVLSEYTPHMHSALASATTRAAIDVVSWHAYWEYHLYDQVVSNSSDIEQRAPGKRKWIDEWGAFWYDDGYSNARLVEEMAPVMPVLNVFGVEAQAVWNLARAYGDIVKWNLVDTRSGTKARFYWVTKLLNRALLSEKDLLDTNLPNTQGFEKADDFFAWGTRDSKDLFVIVMNHKTSPVSVTVDVSAFAPAEGKAVSIYYVPPTSPYAEKTLPSATVTSGRFQLDTQPGAQYVAVIAGGSNSTGRSDAGGGGGADGSSAAGGSTGAAGAIRTDSGSAGRKAGTGGATNGDAATGSGGDTGQEDPDGGDAEAPKGCACRLAEGGASKGAEGASFLVLAFAAALRKRCAARRWADA